MHNDQYAIGDEAFTVRVHGPAEGGYWGEVVEPPGWASQGETLDD